MTTHHLRPLSPPHRSFWLQDAGARAATPPLGSDITTDVAVDQLATVMEPTVLTTQREFLKRLGIDQLVEEGRRIWIENASAPDVAALRARSRIGEAEALLDPAGLGAFFVADWQVRRRL